MPPENIHLLAEDQDLCRKVRSGFEQRREKATQQNQKIGHHIKASPDSLPVTSRMKFPTGTGIEPPDLYPGLYNAIIVPSIFRS